MGNKKSRIRFMRLVAICRAQLASLRRCIARLKFQQFVSGWMLELRLKGLGLETSIAVFPVDQTEMPRMVQLLNVPVHLALWREPGEVPDAVWTELKQIAPLVHGLTLRSCRHSPAFSEFITSVAPQLNELKGPWIVLSSLPPLKLEKVVLYDDFPVSYAALERHTIHRLDVTMTEAEITFRDHHVISRSIKSLGLVVYRDLLDATLEQINKFCRRFTALEELHITGDLHELFHRNLDVHFKKLWSKCLELRERLKVRGLKRLYFTIKHASPHGILAPKPDWTERLKQTKPFDKATFAAVLSNKRDSSDSSADDVEDEDEGDDEAMEEDEELDDSSEDAMDEGEVFDEDGMDDAGGD
ncbi:hypothetical protein M3Y99_00452200 [Aphelenchoides fujianensis]|nr:hypothetical protein M3Y99_00452200 [Aphelenchoides fujianensis]